MENWFSGEYIRGYTKAIMDIMDMFHVVQSDLAPRKIRLSYDRVIQALGIFLEHRSNFRECRDGFIRYNTQKGVLEFYEPKKS